MTCVRRKGHDENVYSVHHGQRQNRGNGKEFYRSIIMEVLYIYTYTYAGYSHEYYGIFDV